jgi:hypothetical protein
MLFASARPARPSVPLLLLALLLAAGPFLLGARPTLAAATFVVTTTGDEPDADLTDPFCDVDAAASDTQCTVRAAIQEANATPGNDTIAFNIPGGGVQTIRPASALPDILQRVTIDGYTQPGSKPNTAATGTNAVLRIQLDGSAIDPSDNADGLRIAGANSLVRGLVVNRFAGDGGGDGVEIRPGTSGVRIQGCFLGTDAAGTAARGNRFGVFVDGAHGVQVGGTSPAARNLISGNVSDGVLANRDATNLRVLGNLIGTTRTGGGNLGNGDDGVDSEVAGAVIGGGTAGEANVVAFNGHNGVEVDAPATANRILRNSIFSNARLGIDLFADGATPNDEDDPDVGANTLQNFPVIETATSTRVAGTLNSTPNQDFVLRLFSNPGASNEGKFFEEGPLVVTTDGEGNASFVFTPDPPIPAGRSVTATATNQGGSTSEFSAAKEVAAN